MYVSLAFTALKHAQFVLVCTLVIFKRNLNTSKWALKKRYMCIGTLLKTTSETDALHLFSGIDWYRRKFRETLDKAAKISHGREEQRV